MRPSGAATPECHRFSDISVKLRECVITFSRHLCEAPLPRNAEGTLRATATHLSANSRCGSGCGLSPCRRSIYWLFLRLFACLPPPPLLAPFFPLLLVWPRDLSGLNITARIIADVADLSCRYRSSSSTYCICLPPQDTSAACVPAPFFFCPFVFHPLLFSFLLPQNNSKLFNLSACGSVSRDISISGPITVEMSRSMQKERCVFSYRVHLIFQPFALPVSQQFFVRSFHLFIFMLCAHTHTSVGASIPIFCLRWGFLRRHRLLCHCESKTGVWLLRRFHLYLFLFPFWHSKPLVSQLTSNNFASLLSLQYNQGSSWNNSMAFQKLNKEKVPPSLMCRAY